MKDKIFKKVLGALCLTIALSGAFAFTACGGGGTAGDSFSSDAGTSGESDTQGSGESGSGENSSENPGGSDGNWTGNY